MGEKAKEVLKLQFDKRLRLEFHGARITSDAGLLACRELDGVLELTQMAPVYLQDTRGGRNVQHEMVPLLRQSVYSRLAGLQVELSKKPGKGSNGLITIIRMVITPVLPAVTSTSAPRPCTAGRDATTPST